MGCRVVFCEDAGGVVGGEDEDGIYCEEGEVGRHDCCRGAEDGE